MHELSGETQSMLGWHTSAGVIPCTRRCSTAAKRAARGASLAPEVSSACWPAALGSSLSASSGKTTAPSGTPQRASTPGVTCSVRVLQPDASACGYGPRPALRLLSEFRSLNSSSVASCQSAHATRSCARACLASAARAALTPAPTAAVRRRRVRARGRRQSAATPERRAGTAI